MSATPMNLNPVNVQTQAAPGKQQDAATPDVPFSQVLSSEIAQKRSDNDVREDADVKTAETASQPAAATGAGAPHTAKKAKEAKDATRDPLDPSQEGSIPGMPDGLLALTIHPDLLKPAPAGMEGALTEQPAASGTGAPAALDARKGRAPLPLQVAQPSDKAADKAGAAQKADSGLLARTDSQAVTTAAASMPNANANASATASAMAFSGELAAARQTDAVKRGDAVPDLVGLPAMQAAPQAPLDLPASLEGVAANRLTPSVGTTAWGQALGEKIVWMAAGAQQTASLTLNPPDMGPLQIVLSVSNDQATASFFSAQPEVRHALESAFPRLREMMSEAGIQLGQATVSADTPRQNDTPERQAQRIVPPFIGTDDTVSAGLHTAHVPVQQSGRGLIDTFA